MGDADVTQFYASRYTVRPDGSFIPAAGQAATDNGVRWASIDFRPDPTADAGWSLVAVDIANNPASLPAGVHHLGDTLAETAQSIKDALANRFGITALADEPDTRRIIRRLLLAEGRTDGTRWRPLRPSRRHNAYRIHLLGLVDSVPWVQGGATITDDFNRANSAALGSSSEGWSWTEVDDAFKINSNRAENANTTNEVFARAESDLASDDHYAEAEFTWSHPSHRQGTCVRFASGAKTFYIGVLSESATNDELTKFVSGSKTVLTSAASPTYTNGDVGRTEADGSTIRSLVNGTEILSVTDTGITGNTRTGIGFYQNRSLSSYFDNFEAGDLGAAPSTVARNVAAAGSFPTSGEIAVVS